MKARMVVDQFGRDEQRHAPTCPAGRPGHVSGPHRRAGRVQIGANNVNVGQITFTGTNTYTGGTFIGDNELILGDNANARLRDDRRQRDVRQ